MRRQFTTRERIGVITESGFSAEGLKLSGSPRAMRALEELVSVLCDMVLGQREQIERVQELCDLTERTVLDAMPELEGKVVVYTSLVRRALDGGSDNCNANLGMADYPWWQQREGRVDD